MQNKNQLKYFVVSSGAGCLIIALILGNLFLGLLFFTPLLWLLVGAVLLLLFKLNTFIARKMAAGARSGRRQSRVIDVEGEVVDKKDTP